MVNFSRTLLESLPQFEPILMMATNFIVCALIAAGTIDTNKIIYSASGLRT